MFRQKIFVSLDVSTNTAYFGAQCARNVSFFVVVNVRHVIRVFNRISDAVDSLLVIADISFLNLGFYFESEREFFVFFFDTSSTSLFEA